MDTTQIKLDSQVHTATLDVHPELDKYEGLYASVTQLEFLHQKDNQPNPGIGLV